MVLNLAQQGLKKSLKSLKFHDPAPVETLNWSCDLYHSLLIGWCFSLQVIIKSIDEDAVLNNQSDETVIGSVTCQHMPYGE